MKINENCPPGICPAYPMVNPALASLLLGINCSDLKLADPSVLMSSESISTLPG